MAKYDRKDHYYRKAKTEGRASRGSFKIEEIQAKYRLIQPGQWVVDLGCSPGGWLQVLAKVVGPTGHVVGIDLMPLHIPLPSNAQFVQADIETFCTTPQRITGLLGGPADLVVSDMAPHTTGVKFQDTYRSYELANLAWKCCQEVLKSGGAFVVKIFDGPDVAALRKALEVHFRHVATFTPKASRSGSRELYLIAVHLRKAAQGNSRKKGQ